MVAMSEDVKATDAPASGVVPEKAPSSEVVIRSTAAGASTYLNDLLKGMIAKNNALKTSKVQRRD
jgi:hypothetical protein